MPRSKKPACLKWAQTFQTSCATNQEDSEPHPSSRQTSEASGVLASCWSNACQVACHHSSAHRPPSRLTHTARTSHSSSVIKMLSNPLQRFSPYQNLTSSGLMPHNHVSQNSMHHTRSMDPLNQGSQYNMHQLHQPLGVSSHQLARPGSQPKQRQQSFSGNGRAGNATGQVRRRISRACDQCNQLRTKCDGQHPCAHCVGKKPLLDYEADRSRRHG